MRVLALDTTTRAGSVALVEDGRVVEQGGDPARSHAERLPGAVTDLLAQAGTALSAVNLFAVAAGPGSFTSLRIGIATLQGLAFVTGRRMVSVSALDALGHHAAAALAPGAIVGVWLDAHRHEVFSALYRVADAPIFSASRLVELEAATVGEPAAILQRWMSHDRMPELLIGDGAALYGDLLPPAMDRRAAPLLAGIVGRIAAERAAAGVTIDPAAAQPLYIRRPDAETERDRRQAATLGPASGCGE